LRSDLRQRSQLLSKELLDLVNGNYEEFLSLGADLKGGEEKVEGVRVGLLGFRREVEGIQNVVREREKEVGELLKEKKEIRKDVVVGRALLEVDRGLGELEVGLGIKASEDGLENGSLEDEDEDDEAADGYQISAPVQRLRHHTRQYILLTRTIERIGPDHPFLLAQSGRMEQIRKSLLLDLAAALRQAKNQRVHGGVLAITAMYADLDAKNDGVAALKGAT
jgi:hypothetical protein